MDVTRPSISGFGTAQSWLSEAPDPLRKVKETVHRMAPPYNTKIRANRRGSRMTVRGFACVALLCAGIWIAATHTMHAQEAPTEYQVKAAYLFNFLKFVDWPDDLSTNVNARWVIGVVGENPFGDELAQAVSGKVVKGHLLEIKGFRDTDDPRACNILFVSASEKKRLPAILTALRGSSVLTVGDMDNFTESGGMIQFVIEDGHVRFSVDVGATGRARLKVSSKLLSLARTVTGVERSALN